MTSNRVKDCWDLVFDDEAHHFCSATPLAAALQEARLEKQKTGRRIIIIPMPRLEHRDANY